MSTVRHAQVCNSACLLQKSNVLASCELRVLCACRWPRTMHGRIIHGSVFTECKKTGFIVTNDMLPLGLCHRSPTNARHFGIEESASPEGVAKMALAPHFGQAHVRGFLSFGWIDVRFPDLPQRATAALMAPGPFRAPSTAWRRAPWAPPGPVHPPESPRSAPAVDPPPSATEPMHPTGGGTLR